MSLLHRFHLPWWLQLAAGVRMFWSSLFLLREEPQPYQQHLLAVCVVPHVPRQVDCISRPTSDYLEREAKAILLGLCKLLTWFPQKEKGVFGILFLIILTRGVIVSHCLRRACGELAAKQILTWTSWRILLFCLWFARSLQGTKWLADIAWWFYCSYGAFLLPSNWNLMVWWLGWLGRVANLACE